MANNHSAEFLRGAVAALQRKPYSAYTTSVLLAEYQALLAAAEAHEAGEIDSIKLAKLIDGMFYCEGGGYDSDDVREGIQKAFEIGVQSAGKMKQACDRHREAYKVAERERVALVKRSHHQRVEIGRLIEQLTATTDRAEAAEKEALDYIDYRNQAVISRNAMERRLEAAESLVAGLRGALEETRKDNEELDGTDAAHPAWWRGNDAGVAQVCAQINAILDGADVSGTASEPWEATRRRVAEARQDSERMRWILCNCELVHAGTLRNGKPVYLESLEELDAARGTK